MPRNYISQEERETIGIGLMMMQKLRIMEKNNRDWMGTEEKRCLKMSATYYEKYVTELMKRVGPKLGKKILNDFKNCEVRFHSTATKPKGVIELAPEAVDQLAEGVMYGHCRVCDNPGKEVCHIRELFISCNVGHLDLDAACPYFPAMESVGQQELLSIAEEFMAK